VDPALIAVDADRAAEDVYEVHKAKEILNRIWSTCGPAEEGKSFDFLQRLEKAMPATDRVVMMYWDYLQEHGQQAPLCLAELAPPEPLQMEGRGDEDLQSRRSSLMSGQRQSRSLTPGRRGTRLSGELLAGKSVGSRTPRSQVRRSVSARGLSDLGEGGGGGGGGRGGDLSQAPKVNEKSAYRKPMGATPATRIKTTN